MDIDEIAEKSAASTFLEGFMIDNGDDKRVDTAAWRASLEDDENIRRLAVGAIMVSEMREAVLKETQFTCSAGVAHNKVRHVSIQIIFYPLIIEPLCSHLEIGPRYSTSIKLLLSWGAEFITFICFFFSFIFSCLFFLLVNNNEAINK